MKVLQIVIPRKMGDEVMYAPYDLNHEARLKYAGKLLKIEFHEVEVEEGSNEAHEAEMNRLILNK